MTNEVGIFPTHVGVNRNVGFGEEKKGQAHE